MRAALATADFRGAPGRENPCAARLPRPFTIQKPDERRVQRSGGRSRILGFRSVLEPRETPRGSRTSQRPAVPASCARRSESPSGARAVGEPRLGPGAHHDRCGPRVPRRAEGLPARGRRGKQRPSDATLPLNPEPRPSFGLSRAESVSQPPPGSGRGSGARKPEWGCINWQPRLPPPPPPTPGAVEPSKAPLDSWPTRGEPSRRYLGFGP